MLAYFFGFSDKFCIFFYTGPDFWIIEKQWKWEPNFEMGIKHRCHSLLGDNKKKTNKTKKTEQLSGWRMLLILIIVATNNIIIVY